MQVVFIRYIVVETDSSILVLALHSHAYDHSPGGSIFLDLKLLILLEFVEVVVSFAPQTCNNTAYELAILGASWDLGQANV
uniref:RNase H type-1 domain-containing protein n=1 Tax=Leersia perrieri TaxID=77586 RepID=A0A0D9WFL5_9ORYZ